MYVGSSYTDINIFKIGTNFKFGPENAVESVKSCLNEYSY